MKKLHNSLLWVMVGFFALANNATVNAQDDLYFDPATDAPASTPATYTEERDGDNNVTRRYNDDDEGYYDDDDDYAYEYSSRIRRFQRRSYAVDYYDPFFVDLYNYDPFYSPGTSIYVHNYNDYWSYRQWRRMQRWNSWNNFNYGYGSGWNTWGWNSAYSFNSPWYNPWVVNNYYYDPYWTCNGYNPYYQNQYYGNGWSNNHYYYNNNNNNGNGGGGGYSPQTYTGPRRGGSHVNPGYARIPDSKGRLATAQTNVPMLEKLPTRPGRTASDIDVNTAVGRGKASPDRTNSPNTGGRRPESSAAEPAGRTRTPEAETPATRNNDGYKPRRPEATKPQPAETPTRSNEGYKPRRSEETPSQRQGAETPIRRDENENEGVNRPRRTESSPTRTEESRPVRRTEESRPVRRTEERSDERPSRSNNGGGSTSQESRSSRSSDSSGSNTRSGSSNSESSKGSNSNNKSNGSGRGGRN